MFCFVLYTFTFYWVIYRFCKRSHSKKLLDLCLFGFFGFFVEAALNCHRRLLVAFVHSVMTNNHFVQILGLIVVDLYMLIILFKLRKKIKNKFIYSLIFIYYFLFLALDVGIFAGVDIIYSSNLDLYRQS